MEDDAECQENELLALEAIYETRQFLRSSEEPGGEVNIYLDLPSPFIVLIPPKKLSSIDEIQTTVAVGSSVLGDTAQAHSRPRIAEISVQYLPPVVLNFKFPKDYPSLEPPKFTLSCKWLSKLQLSELCRHLDEIWKENGQGSVILFEWVQFLNDEILPVLKIESPFPLQQVLQSKQGHKEEKAHQLDDRAFQDIASTSVLVRFLIEYNLSEKERVFDNTYFQCNVCFLERAGAKCISFHPCSHVYCCECMSEYFRVKIGDGAVKALTCPSDKCESQAIPSQVKKLVDSETFAKYETFLLQTTLDCMSDIIYCPRTICQSPVIIEEDTMAICPKCAFAFCTICKRSYHGVSPCPLTEAEFQKIRKEYARGNQETRTALERKYGRKKLKFVLEDSISEQWVEANAKKCPYCKALIQKSEGCNKMTCFKCHNNFCWLCMAKISKSTPYIHFNNPASKCYQKLFLGTVIEEFEDFFGY